MSADTNIPAFPMVLPETWDSFQDGMTLRDWFAGQALAGMMADLSRDAYPYEIAKIAYDTAEAMLAERKNYK
ncbi:MAG: hypothetical protein PWP11_3277 [Thauera sp.]|nr:hypothetical protein [Thauera sp.]MDI3492000.1 hypothetical protein [Thauera sp.]